MKIKIKNYEIVITRPMRLLVSLVVGILAVIISLDYTGFQFYSLFILGIINILLFFRNMKRGFKYGRKRYKRN